MAGQAHGCLRASRIVEESEVGSTIDGVFQ